MAMRMRSVIRPGKIPNTGRRLDCECVKVIAWPKILHVESVDSQPELNVLGVAEVEEEDKKV
jgi:hypothetical protein